MIKKILIISGATASGKSNLALEISKEIDSVIINADSIQLYKELPILSAQPSQKELEQNEHKLYAILDHKDESSLEDWLNLAKKEIDEAFTRNKLPIIVGGTGLYISKLIDGINEIPKIGQEARDYSLKIFQDFGKNGLIEKLKELGDEANIIENLDKQRLLRRLEILNQTVKTLSYWQNKTPKIFYKRDMFLHINLNPKREILYENCNNRFLNMLENGAIKEVEKIMELEVVPDVNKRNSLNKTIGFVEIKDYILDKISKEELINICSQKTRNYAKRQLTWFRNQFADKIEIQDVSRETIQNIISILLKLGVSRRKKGK